MDHRVQLDGRCLPASRNVGLAISQCWAATASPAPLHQVSPRLWRRNGNESTRFDQSGEMKPYKVMRNTQPSTPPARRHQLIAHSPQNRQFLGEGWRPGETRSLQWPVARLTEATTCQHRAFILRCTIVCSQQQNLAGNLQTVKC